MTGEAEAVTARQSTTSGVWAAPGRLNLIGEHTDYNDGFVLPFALDQRAIVTARRLPGAPEWRVSSTAEEAPVRIAAEDLQPGRVDGWAAYVAGVIWALQDAGFEVPGADLSIDSQVPAGAGLSSSAALECAVLLALCDLGDLDLPVSLRPALARRAENEYVGVPCGIMDQAAATLCRESHVLLLDCRSVATEHIPFDPERQGLAVLVIDTQSTHRHSTNAYTMRWRECQAATRALGVPALRDVTDLDAALAKLRDPVLRRRVRHVVSENARVLEAVDLLRQGRLREIGPLLTGSHTSMRVDYEITVAEVDLAVDVAVAEGAYGARMTGGGFGGCVLALVDDAGVGPVGEAVMQAFAGRGFTRPTVFVARPSQGAERLG
jgi:galactokinase